MRYGFIKANQSCFTTTDLCRVLGVSRAGYYGSLKRETAELTKRQKENQQLTQEIYQIYDLNKGRYGSPRIHKTLQSQKRPCSLGRVKRIMRIEGLTAKTGRKFKPRKGRQEVTDTPNLLQSSSFKLEAINQVWTSDITYIATEEGWLYLAGTMDLLSKRIVGYAMADHMKTELIINCLNMAITHRKPAKGLIHHSDRGSQYTSYAFQRKLAAHDFQASFTGTGACLDNATIESFWATLKKELIYLKPKFKTRDEARAAIFEYIETYYNRARIHSSLDYRTPLSFEQFLESQQQEPILQKLAA